MKPTGGKPFLQTITVNLAHPHHHHHHPLENMIKYWFGFPPVGLNILKILKPIPGINRHIFFLGGGATSPA